jgi:hypothetical protein
MRRIVLVFLFALCVDQALAQSSLEQIWRSVTKSKGSTSVAALSNEKIVSGLKEALKLSTGKAVASTGKPDGFFRNEAIKILLPEKLRTAGRGMRLIGMGPQLDQLEVGMNRAAEQATPLAKEIFLNALYKMSFDAQGLDMDEYVLGKTLDGLFYVLAQEEKNIRKDPAARTTDLLREVFGARQ